MKYCHAFLIVPITTYEDITFSKSLFLELYNLENFDQSAYGERSSMLASTTMFLRERLGGLESSKHVIFTVAMDKTIACKVTERKFQQHYPDPYLYRELWPGTATTSLDIRPSGTANFLTPRAFDRLLPVPALWSLPTKLTHLDKAALLPKAA